MKRHMLSLLAMTLFCIHASSGQVLKECLVLQMSGGMSRAVVYTDPVQAQMVLGTWVAPKAGDTVTFPDSSTRQWEAVTANTEGWFEHPALRNGYAFFSVSSQREKVVLLESSGSVAVIVNGEPRVGDVYGHGYVRVPILLKAGENHLLFRTSRLGRLYANLSNPSAEVLLDVRDATLPDLVVGETTDVWLGIVVINATTQTQRGLALVTSHEGGRPVETPVPDLPPLSVRKVPVRLRGMAPSSAGVRKVELRLRRKEGKQTFTLDAAEVTLRVREQHESQKRTFISAVDGSVQYYAVLPAQKVSKDSPPPALVLTLHGAGVEAIGQVDAYSPKTWATLVAPTNRRPFGFNWEDWGRLDALEVLELAQKQWRTDPHRVYLTGHSMGGHGTWQVGLTHPDRFAAIAPSAGWVSIWTYATSARLGQREHSADDKAEPLEEFLLRCAAPSDTFGLVRNSLLQGVYVLHGDADDNVPVAQARMMRKRLAEFHRDFEYYEQPGAGHWWDVSDEPGADCVDWLPIFDFFARHRLPTRDSVRHVEFTTMSPGVSSKCHWVGIEMQERQSMPSSVNLRYDPGKRRFVGTTSNVARLAISLEHVKPGAPLSVEMDGQVVGNISYPARERRIWLVKEGGQWKLSTAPDPKMKSPLRYGGFKSAFANRPVLVYGTKGTLEENAWAYAKARFDSEQFWYRGNATFDVIADVEFQPDRYRDRSVVLYGNAETNAVWQVLLGDSPVQVHRGSVSIGSRAITGENLACLFVRPRAGSDTALVGVVAGTGIAGLRLTDRLPYFTAGAGLPDCLVLSTDMLTQGIEGVIAGGFFGADWGLENSEFIWR